MRIKLIAILFFTGIIGFASVPKEDIQQSLRFGIEEFNKVLTYSSQSTTPLAANEGLAKHFSHLEKRKTKYKSESQFVEYAFYYIHKKLLKKYIEYASIDQTIENGAYDCVTATAVYSLFFTELEIPFSVIETNYHIYVMVYPGTSNEILIETTDPVKGFIANPAIIANRKQLYASNNAELEDNQIDLSWNVENILKDEELVGVLLFNQSVKQFNAGNKSEAIKFATEALTYYSSTRIRSYLNFVKGNQIASN